jgi:aldose 1-epimerase
MVFERLMYRVAAVSVLALTSLFAATARGGPIEAKSFGQTSSNEEVVQYTLTNAKGAVVKIINYGATVTDLLVPDKDGKLGDVCLGFDNIKQYQEQSPYFGAVVGRVGNRIAHGEFTIQNARYCVPVNNGANMLHGGFKGYDKRVWTADTAMTADGPSVRLMLTDPDGSEGFPGTVKLTVIYSLTGDNGLKIQYFATSDKATPINPTNHSYWNLKDAGKSSIAGHVMKIYADSYTPVDDTLIPTGRIAPVKKTPIDFTSPKPIGKDLEAMGGTPIGYDHNMVLRNQDGSLAKAVEVYEPESGRLMEVWTTEPGVQFYSGNFLDGSTKGKDGTVYQQHNAFVLETQHYPDSINHPKFPCTILFPGQVYRQVTEYRFSAPGKAPW